MVAGDGQGTIGESDQAGGVGRVEAIGEFPEEAWQIGVSGVGEAVETGTRDRSMVQRPTSGVWIPEVDRVRYRGQ